MTNMTSTSANPAFDRDSVLQRRMTQGIFGLAIAVLGLMALGSATRVMNAGLSCPDWPLCYGQVLPRDQMNLQVFLEWFHRLVATTIGLVTLGFFVTSLWQRRQLSAGFPQAIGFAVLVVLMQGVLGGLTVTQLLRFDIVTAHLGTGLFFFMTLLTIAISFFPFDTSSITTSNITSSNNYDLPTYLWKLGLVSVICIYGQSLIGGVVASRWALHQCFGQQQLCTVMNSHLLGVIPATLSAIVVITAALRTKTLPNILRYLVYGTGLCLALQLLLGYVTFRLHLQVEILTIMHQCVGAILLGTVVSFTATTYRMTAYRTTISRMTHV
ncbi:MAG: COX15/CtaA family protein [Alkalinema sp. CAN_BIN05]|nr:COX15/CtaA family protein [Alkalinema sp. CAN_BIN05]